MKTANETLRFKIAELEKEVTELRLLSKQDANIEEKSYHLLFENSLDGFAYCKMIYEGDIPIDFIYLSVNPAFERISGIKQVEHKRFSELFPDWIVKDDKFFQIYGSVAYTGVPQKFEYHFVPLEIWASISVICPGKGFFIAIFEDITDKKRIETELAESEKLYKSIFNFAGIALAIADLSGRWLEVNDHFLQMLGYEREEFLTLTNRDITHPDDLETTSQNTQEIIEQKSLSYRLEKRYLKKNGDVIWVDLSVIKITHNGKLAALIGAGIEITNRKKAEQELMESEASLRAIMESTSEMIGLLDNSGNIIDSNEALAKLLGKTRIDILGKNIFGLITKKIPEHQKIEVGKIISSGKPFHGVDCTNSRWLDFMINPIRIRNKNSDHIALYMKDISETKKAVDEMKTIIQRYESLLKTASDGIHVMDEEGNILEVSDSFCQMLGYSREELVSMNVSDFDVEKSTSDIKSNIELSYLHPILFRARHRKKDGNIIEVEISLSSITINNKLSIYASARDITERSRMEKALVEREQLYYSMFEKNKAVKGIIDSKDGSILEINSAACQFYGYTADQMHKMKISDLNTASPEEILAEMARAVKEEKSYFNFRHKKSNGVVVDVEVYSSPIEINGKTLLHSIIHDVTSQKVAEKDLVKIDALLKETERVSKMGGWEYNLQTKKITFTDGINLLFNTDVKSVDTEVLPKYFDPEDWEFLKDAFKSIVDEKLPFSHELLFHNVAGKDCWLKIKGEPILMDGQVVKIVGSLTDITERKLVELELRRTEIQLRELNATKDKFFSIIAHDLKSPFNAIVGFSNLLVDQIKMKDYDVVEEYANIIQSSSNKAMNLLTNLLEWSRAHTGRMIFNPEYLDLAKIIRETVVLFQESASQKLIHISSESPGSEMVFADKAMISTILRNLVSNAVKFTRYNGTIHISLVRQPGWILVSVKDNGIGIGDEALKKMFCIDAAQSTAGTQNEKGTGLGLILCKEFVDKHKGKIWIESESGSGSTAYFNIPAV